MTSGQRQRRRRRGRGGPVQVMFLVMGAVFTLAVIGTLGVVGYVLSIKTPPLSSLRPVVVGATSQVFAANGTPLGFIQSDELRTPLATRSIPQMAREATVAIEDQRFYKHGGVDVEGIIRAALKDITSGQALQGGSTITMQLIRNLYLANDKRTFKLKIEELKLANQLEKQHNKNWILTDYLNSVPYGTVGGQTAIGIGAAARIFFNKPASQLTLAQAALLAGLPQAPSNYNPFLAPQAALARRNAVLQKMAQQGYISSYAAQRTMATPLGVHHSHYYQYKRESFFFDYVKQQLIDTYGANVVKKGGLKIYTTIDLHYQQAARKAIAGQLGQPGDPASAVVTIDPHNGYIRTMAEYGDPTSQFNLASQGLRQPGSTFKTIVLVTALKRGVDPNNTFYDSHELQPGWLPSVPSYHVQTYSHGYSGSINLVQATLQSDNTVYAQLDADLGPQAIRQTAYELGVTTHLDAFPAEGLGGLKLGVSPLEMANVFATLASGGIRNKPIAITKVAFPDRHVDTSLGEPHRVRVIDDAVAAEATNILHQNVLGGTGVAANIGCPAAGKTGTVDNFTDAWFDGFTPHLSTAVWVGYPKSKVPMTSVHGISVAGGTFPAQIWHDYMSVAVGRDCPNFLQPSHQIAYQPFSGQYTTGGSNSPNSSGTAGGAANPTHHHSHHNQGGGSNGGGGHATPPVIVHHTPAPVTPTHQTPTPTPAPTPPPAPHVPSDTGGGAVAPNH